MKFYIIITLLSLFFFSVNAQKPPNLSTGVSANNMTLYWQPNSNYTYQCTPQLIHAYRVNGIRSIRVPISNETLYQDNNPSVLNPAHLLTLDTAIFKKITDSGVVAVLDGMHPMDGTNSFMKRLYSDSSLFPKLRKYWIAMAKYFKKFNPNYLVYELFNEPSGIPKGFWLRVQDSLYKDIRAVDSVHWIILTGERDDATMDGLLTIVPKQYRRVIWGFHFYQPDLFVFQGRVKYPWPIVYPGFPGCTDSIKNATVAVQFYGNRRGIWNAATIDARIKIAYDFGQKYGVPVWLGEFMCFDGACQLDRLRWMADVTASCYKYGIGFCMFDPDGPTVKLITYRSADKTKPIFDTELLKAIGILQ